MEPPLWRLVVPLRGGGALRAVGHLRCGFFGAFGGGGLVSVEKGGSAGTGDITGAVLEALG